MKKELAIWLMQKEIAGSIEQGLRFIEAAEKDTYPEGLTEMLSKQFELTLTLGSPIPEDKALAYLKERMTMGERMIKFWKENPKDTNAIFFFKKCAELTSKE